MIELLGVICAEADVRDHDDDDDMLFLPASNQARVAVVYNTVDEPPKVTLRRAGRHVEILLSLMEKGPVIPARFPTVVRDLAAIQAWLDQDDARLADELVVLRGCVEMAVRCMPEAEATCNEPPRDGREFMLRRLDRKRKQEASQREAEREMGNAHAALQALSIKDKHTPGTSTGSYLVDRQGVNAFQQAVSTLEIGRGFRLFTTGPWPPFSFVQTAWPSVVNSHD